MVPTRLYYAPHSSRLIYTIISLATKPAPRQNVYKRDFNPHKPEDIVFAILIPILVLLSGVFAGLTLGYMSLDETQLNVLSISGTPSQRLYASRIKPIRKNPHLLLVTLLLANMITNETLPVISEPVLGGGVPSVAASTVLIVIFSEIIPQSLCTRHGLYLGAKMAGFTQVLIYTLGIVAWPVAKILELVLGKHHGIIYRRSELKELIAMHSSLSSHGGDLKRDTVTIIGATLDLQEKVVRQAMTPISDVFMLSIDSKLDYDLLKKICLTGHSRVPVYEEVEVPMPLIETSAPVSPAPGRMTAVRSMVGATTGSSAAMMTGGAGPGPQRMQKVKKIIGILLVKQCVLLDPKDAVPLRKIPLNKVPFVPNNEPLLGILDRFQEGRSHMAIVSRFSVEKAASVKKAVKRGLTQRLRERVGMGDSDTSDSDTEEGSDGSGTGSGKGGKKHTKKNTKANASTVAPQKDGEGSPDWDATLRGDAGLPEKELPFDSNENAIADDDEDEGTVVNRKRSGRGRSKRAGTKVPDVEMGVLNDKDKEGKAGEPVTKSRRTSFQLPMPMSISTLEQSMPADAVLGKQGAEEFLQGFDPAVMPLGIITLEDVLEELIGEEIYDEFDPQGAHGDPYVPQPNAELTVPAIKEPVATVDTSTVSNILKTSSPTPVLKPLALKGLNFLRSRSAPPTPRDAVTSMTSAPKRNSMDMDDLPPPPPHIEMPNPVRGLAEDAKIQPSIIVEQHNTSPQPMTEYESISIPLPPVLETKSKSLPPPGGFVSPSISRSASPAPSLEAILLERKRRLAPLTTSAGTSASGSPANLAPPPTSGVSSGASIRTVGGSVKGTRFKSSPLGGGDRNGIVVAEQIRESMAAAATGAKDVGNPKSEKEEGRIPNGKDKEGPDKQDSEVVGDSNGSE